ncbi:hypothetical protein SAMN05428988_0130 [Chitinophaga sp. YR573]|uniref:hypothetical protein n=1 Tax=Chitinophaga sp. YR573 TaxID=1881040 RepID=UPI0008D5A341|nr:hypothetical protein [Chitinophaga sp. YR573]SEV88663.1 hypothetical protein SAMN05428988_0130 [Chitinophaga sp. YR573]
MKIRPRKTLIPPRILSPEEQEANKLFSTASYHCKGAKGTIVHKTHCKEMLGFAIKMKLASMPYTDSNGRRYEKYHYWEKVKIIIEKIQ